MSSPASAIDHRHGLATTGHPGIGALMRGASIEVAPRDRAGLEAAAALLPAGSEVFLPWIAGETHHRSVDAARLLARAGLRPVPHVAARFLSGYTQLGDFLARLAGEAGVGEAMLVGGDRERPLGALASGLDALETGLFARHGFRAVSLPTYPEEPPFRPGGRTKLASCAARRSRSTRAARSRCPPIPRGTRGSTRPRSPRRCAPSSPACRGRGWRRGS